MTKKEFYLKSIIAMAGNPNYVEVKPSEDDPSCTCHVLQKDEILLDAERLLHAIEKEWPVVFEDDSVEHSYSVKTVLEDIAESLSGQMNVIVEQP